ncbi:MULTISPECIES: hydroxymethylbilane synthase [Haloferax]|uniref:Hydroxymethylbilane synthase n=2 Tax=Haloferax TaxID=2251 RepID=A0A6G1YZK7_9EURY|nr:MULTISPECIES: hydroxymethylbilane synthase [Haloferax]KAB1187070.1 hydroxymethylbilane synthase [Haloferax sp. CBA1149]MRW79706.1 hydroxymethylbilane synthase [Haloferax marinisediminis]
MTTRTLRLATRGSALARAQASSVQEALASRRLDVELVEVETEGDRIQDELIHRLGKTGAFVRALDERVLDGDVDAAVHSMKDMPTEKPNDLVVAGVPERAPAGDVLVTSDGSDIDELPEGAVVGTSSLRRQAQLLNYREDLEVAPLRGNVDTRVEKLLATSLQREHEARVEDDKERQGKHGKTDHDGEFDQRADEWFDNLTELERQAMSRKVDTEYDAIVLAEAGLKRSGLADKVEYQRLDRNSFVPAPGQGAIAVTASDPEIVDLVHDKLDHPRTRVETTVERTILAELGGGCIAPIGVHALLQGEHVHVDVQVLATDGSEAIKTSRDLPVGNHANTAREFAAGLRERGADQLIEAARQEAEEE